MTKNIKSQAQNVKTTNILLISDIAFVFTVLGMTLFFRSQAPLIAGLLFAFFHIKFTKRPQLLKNLITAFFIAFIWALFARNNYHYGKNILEINGFCLFPLLAWGMGLFGTSMLLSHVESLYKLNLQRRILLYAVISSVFLIIVEYAAYHVFNFRNQATLHYNAIPLINCIHAPVWMQIAYFLIGPFFGVLLYAAQYAPAMNSGKAVLQENNQAYNFQEKL